AQAHCRDRGCAVRNRAYHFWGDGKGLRGQGTAATRPQSEIHPAMLKEEAVGRRSNLLAMGEIASALRASQ
ncbi:MAG: hypothetical protein NUW24_13815, partial [Anaerolineae bacterium]|nr:hypothetical protein [Anaerolineae bacterium]